MNKEFKKFTLMDETPSAPASDKTIMIDDFEKLAIKLWKESDDRTGNPPYIYSLGVEHGYNNAKESLYTEDQMIEYAEYCATHVLTTQIGHPYLSVKEFFKQTKKD